VIKFAANNVKELSEIEALKGLEDLKNLDLVGNPVAELKDYREKIFEMFPELFVLDNVT
jgi:Leucine-rich repeat (LRR) protein